MQEELAIFDDLTRYFAAHRETYEIGAIPISETFNNVRQALSKEIVIVEEQKNLTRAGHYYRGNPRVLVPKLYPLSTDRVTFMEFVHGEKVAAAFAGKTRSRAKLARRLLDLLAVDVLLAQTDEAPFPRRSPLRKCLPRSRRPSGSLPLGPTRLGTVREPSTLTARGIDAVVPGHLLEGLKATS